MEECQRTTKLPLSENWTKSTTTWKYFSEAFFRTFTIASGNKIKRKSQFWLACHILGTPTIWDLSCPISNSVWLSVAYSIFLPKSSLRSKGLLKEAFSKLSNSEREHQNRSQIKLQLCTLQYQVYTTEQKITREIRNSCGFSVHFRPKARHVTHNVTGAKNVTQP